jgi:hypothetical protein
VDVGAGAGPTPLHLDGEVYLAGPYKGAPLSLAIATPAAAGPFDLGTLVVRVALEVDPKTAQVHAVSDPLPRILRGIPLDIRSLQVQLDRPGFTRNPTSCDPASVAARATATTGQSSPLSSHFQLGRCLRLGFRPSVSVRFFGPTDRGAHPTYRTVIRARPGDANIRRVAVTLPGTELLDYRRIGAICSRAEFAAESCPPGSIRGRAKAWSPLLGRPLEGPVYLRAGKGKLPDLVLALKGQVDVELSARIDSVRGRIRSTFEGLPDVPLRKVMLTMKGGRSGMLVHSGGLCARPRRATASLGAHNSKTHLASPLVKAACREGERGG